MPVVDILLATYNGAAFLDELLSSITAQDFSDWRILVSDDGSSDGTLEKIVEWQNTSDKILLVKHGAASGSAKANFMSLLQFSDAEYVAFCDQDDVWHPDKLSKCHDAILQLEEEGGRAKPCLVYSDARVVDSNLNPISDSFIRYSGLDSHGTCLNQLAVQNMAPGCTMLVNRPLVNLMCRKINYSNVYMHDWWAILIASTMGLVRYVDKPLIDYRQHESNSVGATSYSLSLIPFWMKRLDEMVDYFEALMRQAGEFATCYSNELSNEQVALLTSFSSLSRMSIIGRFRLVSKYGLWKNRFMLCIGEAFCLFRI